MQDGGWRFRARIRLIHIFAIARKDAKIYYLKAPVLIYGILFPICLFFAFVIGRGMPPERLLPGLVGMTSPPPRPPRSWPLGRHGCGRWSG